ncbi:MAG: sterol desaturase family protein [Myxococcota bacterium]|nr:sterol desaturase family protein [Myxococcota bacterium]
MSVDPIPPSVVRFREGLRPTAIGRHYRGWLHFASTSLGCLAVIVFATSRVTAPSWIELLMIPGAFLFANAAEYFAHRGPMHRPRRGLRLIFKRHTQEHHHFFTHDAMAFEGTRDFKMVLFPPLMFVFFLGGIATPVGVLCFLLLSPNCGWLFVASALAYFLTYEWLHFSYHLPADHWLSRLPLMRRLRAHHTHHHNLSLMGKWNFNITFPIYDSLMGTTYRAPSPAAHPAVLPSP